MPDLSDSNKELASPTVVGIGASAGGLAALKSFFDRVPADSGLVFVVVVHLSPEHKSHLADLLQPHTEFPVQQVDGDTLLEPNHVYIIPPAANLSAIDTHLRLSALEQERGQRAPIDHFFRTLASTHDGHAIGVILTGTGSDGSLGIKEIKANGGLVIVQDPNQAEYDGMPQSAISTGMADMILPVDAIPDAILRFDRTKPRIEVPADDEEIAQSEQMLLQKIFRQLRVRTDRDFSRYKRATIMRRIARRMQLNYIVDLQAYVEKLREHPDEVLALADDLLITVTRFFRDSAAFGKLETEAIPRLFEKKESEGTIRVWSVGCATGEETYSIAMLLLEAAARLEAPPQIQIFASDLHKASLEKAREGFYHGDIEADVRPDRLRRFFQKENGGYRVRKEVRELCVFAPHNLLGDPPFSRLDLIACRNLLIYLEREVQRSVVELFHYALNVDGVLLLGSAETVEASDLFRADDKKLCFYRKRNVPAPEPRLPVFPLTRHRVRGLEPAMARETEPPAFGEIHQRMVEQYAPPSVLITPDDKLIHVSEHAGRYMVHPGGEPTANIFRLVRDELRIELRTLLQAAREKRAVCASRPISVKLDGQVRPVVMHVGPAREPDQDGFALIIFEEREVAEAGLGSAESPQDDGQAARIAELESEVEMAGKRMRAIIEEYETGREEMRASNEELQSANEELRSTMEELETSKEELQSINEELQTVNQENRHKVEELAQLSGDLQNLLSATGIATLFLDRNLRIMRFTPKVTDLFNLRTMDRGRPISDLTHRLGYDQLQSDAQTVLDSLAPAEREVQDDRGHWYLTRVLPYRSAEDRIEGVVITFVDITRRVMAETRMRISEARLSAELYAMQHLHELVASLMVSPDLRTAMEKVLDSAVGISDADKGNIRLLSAADGDAENATMDIVAQQGFQPQFLEKFGSISINTISTCGRAWKLGKRMVIEDIDADTLYHPHREIAAAGGYRAVQSTPLVSRDGRVLGILSTHYVRPRVPSERDLRILDLYSRQAADFIERCRAEDELRQSEQDLRNANAALSRSNANLKGFAYAASHDLREPLRTVSAYSQLLIEASRAGRQEEADMAAGFILENNRKMEDLLTDLLAYTQIIVEDGDPGDQVNLNLAAGKATANLQALIDANHAVVTCDPLPVVNGHEAYFIQLFQNLIDNAIKYRGERTPEVHISAVRREKAWELSVSDNGIGIKPEYREQVFDIFKRLHEKEIPGTGLGLALSRRVVERSGGRLWVEGNAEGSVFRFTLPDVAN